VVLGIAACDFLWVFYIKAVNANQVFIAVLVGAFIHVLGGIVVIEYARKPILLIAVAIGSCMGTILSMYISH